jgi:hypothetical protein
MTRASIFSIDAQLDPIPGDMGCPRCGQKQSYATGTVHLRRHCRCLTPSGMVTDSAVVTTDVLPKDGWPRPAPRNVMQRAVIYRKDGVR